MIPLSSLLRGAVERGEVPGAAGVVLTREGVAWSDAAGLRDAVAGAPMAGDTVAWIASMTKPLTTIAALQCVERGLLSLDGPVADVLPQLVAPQVLAGMDGDRPVLRPADARMTLRQLLTHTSGYSYPRWDAALLRSFRHLGLDPAVRSFDELARVPLVADPGTRWTYGIGIDVAGKMIEAATGRPLDQVIADGICRPLGMADTVFVLSDAQRARAMPIHVRDGGRWVPLGPVAGRTMPFLAGGGGMYGTAGDYARLLAELLAGAPRLLSAEGWSLMTTNGIGELHVDGLRSADAAQSLDLDLTAGQPGKWTLGFLLNPVAMPGRRGAGSLSWAGLAGVMVTSVLPFGHAGALGLFEAFERAACAM